MYEATLRIRDDSAYAAATAGTSATIELWCNEHCDLLHVSHEVGGDVLERVRETVGIEAAVERGDEVVAITADCLRHHEIDDIEGYLRRHGVLLLPPLRYQRGAKVCRLLAVSAAALTACFRDLVDSGFDVSVESKREVSFASGDAPLLAPLDAMPDLTGRQREALKLAYEHGYYDLPRGTGTEAIAAQMGVTRRTAEEHLRRAERKVMESVVRYLF
ncbi:transcriptional regulator [Haloferax sp. MBLA0076]|uniref:Transcriptional regulator n=1 Tax=Haloferax litoreum TaxID=2666140 RepID=A0A6A8GMG4_9EURY|nr:MULTISPECIES: helix-turn-helix domain-containing protein [Haloferax]KAB1190047.1 transcriptional regulator [Haloferax sp. CBA1148]MRX23822.1 transcriptional regulator [Haloferax litoreum]